MLKAKPSHPGCSSSLAELGPQERVRLHGHLEARCPAPTQLRISVPLQVGHWECSHSCHQERRYKTYYTVIINIYPTFTRYFIWPYFIECFGDIIILKINYIFENILIPSVYWEKWSKPAFKNFSHSFLVILWWSCRFGKLTFWC